MRHQVQNGFCGISVVILQHQKGYLFYVPHKQKIISSCDVVFDESFSSELTYTSFPYSDAMAMQPEVSYATYATYSVEQTGDIITFTQFEEGGLLSESWNSTGSGNGFDDDSTLAPLISEAEMDGTSSGDESGAEPMAKDMLEEICDGSQYNPIVNRVEARYKIRDRVKQSQAEWIG